MTNLQKVCKFVMIYNFGAVVMLYIMQVLIKKYISSSNKKIYFFIQVDNENVESQLAKAIRERDELRRQLDAQLCANAALTSENENLRLQLDKAKNVVQKFLNNDQITLLNEGRVSPWLNESIIKGLKFRFALSVHGYEYLRESGYPLPAYSTLMRRIQNLTLTFGIFDDVLTILKFKVEFMDITDTFCIISYDEMIISEQIDFDKNTGMFFGNVTLGNENLLGQKIFVVVARGVKTKWKQIIACHVTRKETIDAQLLQTFLKECILRLEKCGLHVLALSSDLDWRNRSIWSQWNIEVTKFGTRSNSFVLNDHEIFAMPDVCHLLKNLKASMLSQDVFLPLAYAEQENLPTNVVKGSYVKSLWDFEISHNLEKRLLHHLRKQDMEPSNFDKMNVGAAVRFFSPKTSGALKTAVQLQILPQEALTTAEFILLIHQWFTLVSSQVRKVSITSRNCDRKYIFLHSIIDIFQNTVFGKGWKPLNFGFVLATLSFADMAEFLFGNGFDFVLGHRFTQDVTENIFSQIRRKEGKLPSALKSLRAIRSISVAQYVSDVKRTSYLSDSDVFLLDFCEKKKKSSLKNVPSSKIISRCSLPSIFKVDVETFSLSHFTETVDNYNSNSIFYIAGSTARAVSKHACFNCTAFLYEKNLPDIEFVRKAGAYTRGANQGGLKEPSLELFLLTLHCEKYFQKYKRFILNKGTMDVMTTLSEKLNIPCPQCCNVKVQIIRHFFTVRAYCVKNFSENYKALKTVYGTSSAKRKRN